ncbi:hypothetical protein [Kitasatospora griseola]|uniref:hypothetical protein n=1 Tax=Kitasatospora griseola TaxID=2064 RepID=UPI0037FD9D13
MTADHPHRPLGHGVDREHQDVADTAPPRRPGRTVAELAALLAAAPATPPAPRPTGRRPLGVRPEEAELPAAD